MAARSGPCRRSRSCSPGAGVGKHDSKAAMRSVDILPTILDRLGIDGRSDLDGEAVELTRR